MVPKLVFASITYRSCGIALLVMSITQCAVAQALVGRLLDRADEAGVLDAAVEPIVTQTERGTGREFTENERELTKVLTKFLIGGNPSLVSQIVDRSLRMTDMERENTLVPYDVVIDRVRNDGVVQYRNGSYQLEGISRRVKGVRIEERIDGSIHIRKNGSYVKYRKISSELIAKPQRRKEKRIQRRPRPSKDHPWRKFRIKPCVRTHV